MTPEGLKLTLRLCDDTVASDLSGVNTIASGLSLFLPLPLFMPELFPSSVCGGPQLRELLLLIYPEYIQKYAHSYILLNIETLKEIPWNMSGFEMISHEKYLSKWGCSWL